jgi:G3E family GTPase
VSVQEQQPLLVAPLKQLLRELPGEVLRVKGLVRVLSADAGGQPEPQLAVLQLAGQRIELVPASPETARAAAAGSTLVFIGEDLDESWLRLRLSACRAGAAARSDRL